ncbi:MAG: cupredoxin domain-containing protein [Acidimicrobiia bacterium]|jgi:uncharacterized cupredoxin-like copper-binding protein
MRTSAPTRVHPRTSGLRALVGGLAVAALAAIPVTAGALEPAAKSGATVKVKLFEFQVKPKPKFATAGTVRFKVKNIGTEKHEFVVVKSDGTELPLLPDGSVDEEAIPEADKFGEVEDLKPKKSGSLTVKSLPAGDYVLFCNIVEDMSGTTMVHYAEGMHTDFTVG